jgi:hypothetical protein
MKKTRILLLSTFCLLVSTCGSFNASFTDKKGVTYYGGTRATSDNKSTVNDGP